MAADKSLAHELLARARSEPAAALVEIECVLSDPHQKIAGSELSVLYRAAGLAARSTHRLDTSRAYLEASAQAADSVGDHIRGVEARMSLAANSYLEGDSNTALAEISQLETEDDALRARIEFQWATMLARMGRTRSALDRLNHALKAIRRVGDERMTAVVLKNRGMLGLLIGDFETALVDTTKARGLFESLNIAFEVAYCDHNLALVEAHSGNLPMSLALFEKAEAGLRAVGTTNWAKAGHCYALLAAGLAHEAVDLAELSIDKLDDSSFLVDKAEVLAIKAEAEAALGWNERAASTARAAATLYEEQGRHPFAAIAELAALRADPPPRGARRAARLGDVLAAAGMQDGRDRARLLAAELTKEPAAQTEALNRLSRPMRRAAFDLRLQHVTALSSSRWNAGRTRAAAAAANRGSQLLERYQALVGLSDVRLGLRSSASELHDVGLAAAIRAGRNLRVFDWIERGGIAASLTRRPEPVTDVALRRALTELSAARRTEDEPTPARRRELERVIRTLARTKAPRITPERADHAAVSDALGDRVMVSFGVARGRLAAVRLVAGRLRRFDLGALNRVDETVQRTRRDLTIRASDPLGEAPHDLLQRLDDLVLQPLKLPSNETILVVPPELAAVPWSALPSLSGVPVTVARSASGWLHADASRSPIRTTIVVDGPRLAHSSSEAQRVAAITQATHLRASASVDETLDAINGTDCLHIASHGRLRTDNPLFSSLELHGGNLSAYHLLRLRAPPSLAVLSACHLALGAGPGESLLGFTDAFLSAGTSSVIASTLPVPDTSVTVDLMVDLHERLASGERPAAALAHAQASLPDEMRALYTAAFTCFGAG